MEFGFLLASILLLLFALLAVYDGFYLHIFKYALHNQAESKMEHLTHTARAILFPGIVFFLFVKQDCLTSFYIGMALVAIDILVLGADAWMEQDSRAFMGGLPRWEYILHLFVNGFHFASIAVFLTLKVQMNDTGIEIVPNFAAYRNAEWFRLLAINLLPGAVLLALLHVAVSVPATASGWNRYRAKITCC